MMDDPGGGSGSGEEDSGSGGSGGSSMMMLSTTPGHHHPHRRRRPRPGSPPSSHGFDDHLLAMKRQMLVAGAGLDSGGFSGSLGGGGAGGRQYYQGSHQQQPALPVPLVHTHHGHGHSHSHLGAGAGFFGPPAATTLLPAAAAAAAMAGPFRRPSSPYCAAADLAAAASALSMSGGGSGGGTPPDDEFGGSWPLVPVVAPATGWAGFGGGAGGNSASAAAGQVQLLAVRCEWVPGPGSGKVHVVAPPALLLLPGPAAAAAEVATLEEAARVAHSFVRLWGPGAWAPLLTGKDAVVRFVEAGAAPSSSSFAYHQQQQQQQRRRFAAGGEGATGAFPPAVAAAALGAASASFCLGGGLGAGVFLALLQLASSSVAGAPPPLRFRPRVAVFGELTLEGRVILASSSSAGSRDASDDSGGCGGDRLLAARVEAVLGAGRADCVVLPRGAAEDGGRARLGFAAAAVGGAASVRFAGDVRELVALAVEDGPGAAAHHLAWLPPPRGAACGGGGSGGSSSSGDNQVRRLFVAPTLLPADGAVAAVAARCVEACALPRPLGGPPGRFIVTGLPHAGAAAAMGPSVGGGSGDKVGGMLVKPDGGKAPQPSSTGSGSATGHSARAALNTARFLLLKHQGDIARLLGPPSVDLRAMRLCPAASAAAAAAADPAGNAVACMEQEAEGAEAGGMSVPVDVHLHLPHALPSPGYALPAFLALVAVAWPGARDSLEGIASLGEVNAVGALGLHGRLRPTFVAALNGCGARKVVLPSAQARELVREEGGGVGDRWLLQSGVLVQGAERVLDVVRGVFLGDDGL